MDHFRKVDKAMIYPRALLLWLVVSAAAAMSAFCETSDEALDLARKLVEAKRYDEALERYSQIESRLRSDAGLLIEWARVHTYADHHAEAIKLFEEVRRDFPEKAPEILRELGDQYKWNGQLQQAIDTYTEGLQKNAGDSKARAGLAQALAWAKKHAQAIEEYNRILKDDPNSTEALTGKADVFSWDDELEEAWSLYEQVLEREPENVNAQNSLARILVWQGYHRKGAARYRQILEGHPEDPDALEGLAFAEHWQGREDLALETAGKLLAAKPDRREAGKLFAEINAAQEPYVTAFSRYSSDSNHLDITTEGVRSGLHLDPSLSLELVYSWQKLYQRDQPTILANRSGVGVSKIFSDSFELNSFAYGVDYDEADLNCFTTNTWFTFKPSDIWRFDIGVDRETFDDVGALLNRIVVDSVSGSVDCRPSRWWFFSAKYKKGNYSDENRQESVLAKMEYRLNHMPYVKLYYNLYYSDWHEQLNHGYFNPLEVSSHSVGVYSGVKITDSLFAEAQMSRGYESQRPTSKHPTYFGAAGLDWRLAENWSVSLRGEYFEACRDSNSDGYVRTMGLLSITYNFGAAHIELEDGAQPARPSGGE
ncbi:MAG: tetratricopeptide repeat protein [Planctomycetota bacterium]|nr:tetratricopeptide repeat protein [Planctomycetota bacterium]